jgi:hypothetical protein
VVEGVDYDIRVDTADPADVITVDLWTAEGSHLQSKSLDSGETYTYKHREQTGHVLMLVRPRNPIALGIQVTGIFVAGVGNFPKTSVHLNVFVAGKFTGLGIYNDLATDVDRGQFTDAVMAKVQSLFAQTGITISYEGFSYTAAQVQAINPNLIGPDDRAVCSAGEFQTSTGFEQVDTDGLDAWGELGFPASDPNFTRAHAIDVFVIHHFDEDGTVGLSPRPGVLLGNGRDTALGTAAFLQLGGTLYARTVDQIGTVLAHEIGHFLGLMHTTTFSPGNVNPTEAIDDGLADTPTCTVLTDVNLDGFVGIGDGCQDEDNVMFYQAGLQTDFSAQQSTVMQNMLSIQEH